nr:sulfate ABC transporter permease subunit CysT [Candidatus Solirubrobacter pratensis]
MPRVPRAARRARGNLGLGISTIWLSLIVLIPLASVVVKSTEAHFWSVVTSPRAISAFELTIGISLAVAAINAAAGTLIAWVLVRDRFFGKGVVDAFVDLPFALPTIVAGLTLLALYGKSSPFGIDISYTRWAILLALLFVTLPFVVRSVQPVLIELDPEMEQAAASLGATEAQSFRRIVLPNLWPAIVSGAALAFARAVGEFGSVVLISGNIPRKTEVVSVFAFAQIESDATASAAAISVVLLALSLLVLLGIRSLGRTR